MYPILGRYGQFFIYSYTVVWAIGVLAGLWLTARLARGQEPRDWFDAWLVGMIAALLGGRAGFILFRWDYYAQRPSQIWQFQQGGLSYTGALLAGLCAIWLYARWQGRPFTSYAGLFAPALALITTAGWLACALEGCAYGRQTFIGIFSADLPDDFGIFAVRYQTQMLGFLLSALVFALTLWLWPRWSRYRLFWFTLGILSLVHLLVSLLRGDPMSPIGPLRVDTLFNGILTVIGFSLALSKNKRALSLTS